MAIDFWRDGSKSSCLDFKKAQQVKRPHVYQAQAVNIPPVRLWPAATDSRSHPVAMPKAGENEEDCVANVDFSSDGGMS